MSRKKNGEKATLLSKCGDSLFGCSGELLPTQGIYVPKSLSTSSSCFICKRTVWVPHSISHECLAKHLESFGATLPFSIQRVASLHRFGLCGISPTRSLRAIDRQFLLLAKVPHKYFAVYGIVEIRQPSFQGVIFIENISTTKDDIMKCVEWIHNELAFYQDSRETSSQGHDDFRETVPDKEDKSLEIESESQEDIEGTQDPIQNTSDETESDILVNTPEFPNHEPSEYVSLSNVSFNNAHLPNPNIIFWISCLPPQSTTETTGYPFSTPSQPSSLENNVL